MKRFRACVVGLLASACASSAVQSPAQDDAGSPADASVAMDASSGADAGLGDTPDASLLMPDAGRAPDAGSPMPLSGTLIGGPGPYPGSIAGVHYFSGSLKGETDANGTYRYEPGQTVTFSVDSVVLAEVPGAPVHTPFALGSSPACGVSSNVRRVLVLLETLDVDHDPTNGIRLPAFSTSSPTQVLARLDDPAFAALLARLAMGTPTAAEGAAVDRFIAQVDGETWAELGVQTFSATDSAVRSQGIASDGASVWFSWRYGLQRTDMQYNVQVKNTLAIPAQISFATHAGDHIGDMDVYGNTLYAGVEDSKAYAEPRVLLYDADTLNWQNKAFDMPNTLLTQGIPWVCVDGPASHLYAAEWNPTTSLLEFDMVTMQLQRQVPLSETLGRIQGAKVWDGMLYANADDSMKTLYKINRETGTVIDLMTRVGTGEQEGIGFFKLPDGSTMHTTNATTTASAMEIHHLHRTRDPIRDAVCPGG
jgi:hypothetical protein